MSRTPVQEVYLDHAATTTPRPEAIAAMEAAITSVHANASGFHTSARRAKNALEEARERAAELIGTERRHDVVFTSGGTESDNLAVMGAAFASRRRTIIVSAIEHKAVLEAARSLARFGYAVQVAPVDEHGVLIVDRLAELVDGDTAVVSVMAANNEVGTFQPVGHVVETVRSIDDSIPVHTDAVQFFVGRDLDVTDLGVDLASLSAHKFGGPTGVGLLYVAAGTRIESMMVGGSQEAGRRAGTSNVVGVLGMVAAMEETARARARFDALAGAERDAFEAALMAGDPTSTVTGADVDRLLHFSHVRVPAVLAETLLIRLDQGGVFAAAGSSCQSGAVEPSHVLTAMGLDPDAARECVRFTFGWDVEPGTGTRSAQIVLDTIKELR